MLHIYVETPSLNPISWNKCLSKSCPRQLQPEGREVRSSPLFHQFASWSSIFPRTAFYPPHYHTHVKRDFLHKYPSENENSCTYSSHTQRNKNAACSAIQSQTGCSIPNVHTPFVLELYTTTAHFHLIHAASSSEFTMTHSNASPICGDTPSDLCRSKKSWTFLVPIYWTLLSSTWFSISQSESTTVFTHCLCLSTHVVHLNFLSYRVCTAALRHSSFCTVLAQCLHHLLKWKCATSKLILSCSPGSPGSCLHIAYPAASPIVVLIARHILHVGPLLVPRSSDPDRVSPFPDEEFVWILHNNRTSPKLKFLHQQSHFQPPKRSAEEPQTPCCTSSFLGQTPASRVTRGYHLCLQPSNSQELTALEPTTISKSSHTDLIDAPRPTAIVISSRARWEIRICSTLVCPYFTLTEFHSAPMTAVLLIERSAPMSQESPIVLQLVMGQFWHNLSTCDAWKSLRSAPVGSLTRKLFSQLPTRQIRMMDQVLPSQSLLVLRKSDNIVQCRPIARTSALCPRSINSRLGMFVTLPSSDVMFPPRSSTPWSRFSRDSCPMPMNTIWKTFTLSGQHEFWRINLCLSLTQHYLLEALRLISVRHHLKRNLWFLHQDWQCLAVMENHSLNVVVCVRSSQAFSFVRSWSHRRQTIVRETSGARGASHVMLSVTLSHGVLSLVSVIWTMGIM